MQAAAKDFFARDAAEKLRIDITQSTHHRGYGAIATEQLDPSLPSDLKETFDMGLHLDAGHPDVLAGKPLRGPNRHPGHSWLGRPDGAALPGHAGTGANPAARHDPGIGHRARLFRSALQGPGQRAAHDSLPAAPHGDFKRATGAGAHTDYGCITLLYQDTAGGLQVRDVRGEWIDAPPIDGTFVVNLGDMMARWSNDRYLSTPHRVISPLGVDRYSMPFFAEPHPDTRTERNSSGPLSCHDLRRVSAVTLRRHLRVPS